MDTRCVATFCPHPPTHKAINEKISLLLLSNANLQVPIFQSLSLDRLRKDALGRNRRGSGVPGKCLTLV